MLLLLLILKKVHDDYENHLLTALSYDESVDFNPGQGSTDSLSKDDALDPSVEFMIKII